jgi:parvulin-like peptidyl-prolyl isomerase
MSGKWMLRAGLLAVTLTAGMLFGWGAGAQEAARQGADTSLEVNQVMRVGETIITAEQLLARIWEHDRARPEERRIVDTALTDLRDTALVEMEAARVGLTVSEEEIDQETEKRLEFIKAGIRENLRGLVSYEEWLRREGYTKEAFEEEVRRTARVALLRRVLVRYFENMTESVQASHILFGRDLAKAQEVYRELRDTPANKLQEVFEDRAVQFSLDPGRAMTRGRLPRIYRNDGSLVKEAAEALWKLSDGEISEPVKTDFGYHIFWRRQTLSPDVKPLSEVRDEYLNAAEGEDERMRFHRWVRWVFNERGYKVERRLPGYDARPDQR